MNFAVFASTNGSDLPSILKAFKEGKIDGKIVCGLVNNKNCGAQKKLENKNIPVFYIDHQNKTREEFDNEMHKILINNKIDYIICVGFMRILSENFVNKWERKIINVHPALLPAFPGAHAIQDALDYKVKVTGATIHFIDSGVDTGPILAQKSCTVDDGDTLEIVKDKIQKIEQELYPQVLEKISKGELK